MSRQPTIPKGPASPASATDNNPNVVVFDFGQLMTPEERRLPVMRLRGARPLSEILAELQRLGVAVNMEPTVADSPTDLAPKSD